MKALVVHKYGSPEVLKFEDYPDPAPGAGEVLVRVAAASVNPLDYKRRAGLTADYYPIHFPQGVRFDPSGGAAAGDDNGQPAPFGYGNQAGQAVLVAGAVGNVGRSAVFTAKERGATVIAGVLKRQVDEARTAGADLAVATDDDKAIANLPPLAGVADTIDGRTAEKLIAKVKPGGVFATVLKAPQNAAKYPAVKVEPVFSKFDRKTLEFMGEAGRDGKLVIPIARPCHSNKRRRGSSSGRKRCCREDPGTRLTLLCEQRTRKENLK